MPAPLVRRLLVTAAVLWAAFRLALGTLGVVQISYLGTVGLAAAVSVATWGDLRRNTELMLYANLGVSPVATSVVVVVAVLVLELAVGAPLWALLLPTLADVPT